MLQQLTSIRDKKVTVRFIGPAVITYIVRVGVNWMFVILETFCWTTPSSPIHEYDTPSILTIPCHPKIAYSARSLQHPSNSRLNENTHRLRP